MCKDFQVSQQPFNKQGNLRSTFKHVLMLSFRELNNALHL